MKLAGLVTLVAKTLPSADVALAFITKVLNARQRLGEEAALCLDMDIVTLKIQLGDVETTKVTLDQAKLLLPTIKSSESVIFSKFYKATTEYRKVWYTKCDIQ